MTHDGIFATSDDILVKAGEGYDTGVTEARINSLCTQVESLINCFCRYNFSDNYATLNADVKGLLTEAASNLAAIYIINYNMRGEANTGYGSRIEAEDMVNILRDGALRAMMLLKDKKVVDFINGA